MLLFLLSHVGETNNLKAEVNNLNVSLISLDYEFLMNIVPYYDGIQRLN